MNTSHHTSPTKDKKKFEGFGSGSLRRTDQEARSNLKTKGKYPQVDSTTLGPGQRAISHFGSYGTIGAKLTRPER